MKRNNGNDKLYQEDEPRFYTKAQLEEAGHKNVLHDEAPSVTTVNSIKRKGPWFERWLANQKSYSAAIRYRDNRARIGLATHKVIARRLNGKRVTPPAKSKLFFKNFLSFEQQYKPVPLGVELIIYNRRAGYAGTLDFVGDVQVDSRKLRVLIDWKTTKSRQPDDHKPQAAAYWEAVRKLRVQEVWVVYLKRRKKFKDGQILKMSIPETEYNFTKFMHRFEVWKDENPGRVKVRRTYRHGHLEHISSIMRKYER